MMVANKWLMHVLKINPPIREGVKKVFLIFMRTVIDAQKFVNVNFWKSCLDTFRSKTIAAQCYN